MGLKTEKNIYFSKENIYLSKENFPLPTTSFEVIEENFASYTKRGDDTEREEDMRSAGTEED